MKFDKNSLKTYIKDLAHGIERETLRVFPNSVLATTAHPNKLGSKLTHPFITTDYAESLLEFVTSPNKDHDATIDFLEQLHHKTFEAAPAELLWPSSMPCVLPEDKLIAVADYGRSNSGKMKTVYRIGLGHRYGRSMQTIAGIHYNFSLPKEWIISEFEKQQEYNSLQEYTNRLYFHIIRNFKRYDWIIAYLFGASPVVDQSFLNGKKHNLEKIAKDTWGLPYATSLRMGGLGYTSSAQKQINICFNGLKTYIKSIEAARHLSYPAYEKIGVKVDGEYRQLSSNLLQIDNEFYARIRPKRVRLPGENSLMALHQRGIEYLEVRLTDVNPYSNVGINSDQMKFIDLLLVHCLVADSPKLEDCDCQNYDDFFAKVVTQGRDPQFKINEKAHDLILQLKETAKKLNMYFSENWLETAQNYNLLPSASIINELKSSGKSFIEWNIEKAELYKNELMNKKLSDCQSKYLDDLAVDSLEEQKEIEENDNINFDEYLANFYKKTRLEFND